MQILALSQHRAEGVCPNIPGLVEVDVRHSGWLHNNNNDNKTQWRLESIVFLWSEVHVVDSDSCDVNNIPLHLRRSLQR